MCENDHIVLNQLIEVSVVMPVYNEELYIRNCIESLLRQTFPLEKMEWIFVDGMSKDKTVEILEEYKTKYPKLIKIYRNKHQTVPYAMNIGINEANGDYIIRLDAHADYAEDYIYQCVRYLNETGADNVGGVLTTKGKGFLGETIAKMLSSKFGVGNSGFRTSANDGYVDTVPFGAFKKEVFEKYGLYDTRLTRNQDNEMNYRIRKNGGKIYLSNNIKLSYYCRNTFKGIVDMALKNGKWNIITMKLCPGSMGLRHFIPMLFVISLLCFPILIYFFPSFQILFFIEILLYLGLDIYYSFKISSNLFQGFILFFLFLTFHISYGIGSIIGLFQQLYYRR